MKIKTTNSKSTLKKISKTIKKQYNLRTKPKITSDDDFKEAKS
jgi:hypothetical protein